MEEGREDQPKGDAATADRFEVLSDDLIRRIEMRHRLAPEAMGDEVLRAATRLKGLIAEVGATWTPDPLQEKKDFLIERQGALLTRAKDEALRLRAELATACLQVAALADEKKRLEDELAKTMRTRVLGEVALKAMSSDDLAHWQEICVRCKRRRLEHDVRDGRCPEGEAKPIPVTPERKDKPESVGEVLSRFKAATACYGCGVGKPERKAIREKLVWWCAECARRGGSEDAGIRGTGGDLPGDLPVTDPT